MSRNPLLFIGGDVNTLYNLAPLPENTIYLFPIFEPNTQMSVLNNIAARKALHLFSTYNFFSYLTLLHSLKGLSILMILINA